MIRAVPVVAVATAGLLAMGFAIAPARGDSAAGIRPHLTPDDIRRALIPTRRQRVRIVRAHPHFPIYKEAKRVEGVSWFLMAAVHARHRSLQGGGVLAAARRLRRAGAGGGLDRRAHRALVAYGESPAGAAQVLQLARTWKALGIIALPALDGMVRPVAGVIPSCGHFHCPRPGHLHNGIDVLAATGTPVRAVQAGRVAAVNDAGSGYGTHLCVQHSARLASCYAHLSRLAPGIANGRVVSRGQVIGRVGCTGHCYGPHLHFEIRRGPARCSACAVDPVPYLEGTVGDMPYPDLRHRPARTRAPRATATAAPVPVPAAAPRAAPVVVVPQSAPRPAARPAPAPAPPEPTGGATPEPSPAPSEPADSGGAAAPISG